VLLGSLRLGENNRAKQNGTCLLDALRPVCTALRPSTQMLDMGALPVSVQMMQQFCCCWILGIKAANAQGATVASSVYISQCSVLLDVEHQALLDKMLTTPKNSSEVPRNAEQSARAVKLRHKRHCRHQRSAAGNVDLVQKTHRCQVIALSGRAAASGKLCLSSNMFAKH